MDLSLGDGSFTALMTSGVATIPEERGRGHMYDAMRFLQGEAERRGIRALFNHPQRQGAYAHLGFRPSTFTKYWQGEGAFPAGEIAPFRREEAFLVYAAMADRYTGIVHRDRDAFRLKMADYASDGARASCSGGGEDRGLLRLLRQGGGLRGGGPVPARLRSPAHELQRIAGERSASAKLPPDADAPGEIRPQNVMLAPEDIWQAMEPPGTALLLRGRVLKKGFDLRCGADWRPKCLQVSRDGSLTCAAARAMGSALDPHWGFVHYRTRSDPVSSNN